MHIDLSRKCLTTFTLDMLECDPGGVTSLNLSHNQLPKLPAEIGKLKMLEWLDLGHNQLTELPVEIGKLKKLKKLWLERNKLRELPAEIGNLGQLKQLVLYSNQLKKLPAEIGNLGQLYGLELSYNQLRELPVEIGKLISLEEFGIAYNQLTELPITMLNLNKITGFYYKGNKFGEAISDILYIIKNIKHKKIELNKFQRIECIRFFEKINDLEKVYIKYNIPFTDNIREIKNFYLYEFKKINIIKRIIYKICYIIIY